MGKKVHYRRPHWGAAVPGPADCGRTEVRRSRAWSAVAALGCGGPGPGRLWPHWGAAVPGPAGCGRTGVRRSRARPAVAALGCGGPGQPRLLGKAAVAGYDQVNDQ
jgi:hypothetical protein